MYDVLRAKCWKMPGVMPCAHQVWTAENTRHLLFIETRQVNRSHQEPSSRYNRICVNFIVCNTCNLFKNLSDTNSPQKRWVKYVFNRVCFLQSMYKNIRKIFGKLYWRCVNSKNKAVFAPCNCPTKDLSIRLNGSKNLFQPMRRSWFAYFHELIERRPNITNLCLESNEAIRSLNG